QPSACRDAVESKTVGVLGQNRVTACRIKCGLKILDKVQASRSRWINEHGIRGLPGRRKDRVNVRTDAFGGVVDLEGRFEIWVRGKAVDHCLDALRVES